MASIELLLADGNTAFFKVTGAGSEGDPYVTSHILDSGLVAIDGTVEIDPLPAGSNTIGATLDAGYAQTTTLTYTAHTTVSNVAFNITPNPSAGEYIKIVDLFVSVGADCLLILKDDEGTPNSYAGMFMTAGQPLPITTRGGWRCLAADARFTLTTSTAGVVVYVTAVTASEA